MLTNPLGTAAKKILRRNRMNPSPLPVKVKSSPKVPGSNPCVDKHETRVKQAWRVLLSDLLVPEEHLLAVVGRCF
jgi:hypothetical protein